MSTIPDLTHLGAENCVTGSCHLLQCNGLNIMVDCGAVQGNDQALPLSEWPVAPDNIDYIFLTHAHIDHIGRLPSLITSGFNGDIICSHPTKALLGVMLRDAMNFMDYSGEELEKILGIIDELSWGFEYGQSFDLKGGASFSLGRAGHILGFSFIRFVFRHGTNEYSVLFSGDLGNLDTPLLPDPEIPEASDLLVLESTYGNRLHEDREKRLCRLGEVISATIENQGTVYIPAFALGRTQELLYELDRLFTEAEWRQKFPLFSRHDSGTSPVPVFVDTPLGAEITKIFSFLAQFWDQEAKELMLSGDDPLDFNGLYSAARFHDHVRLLDYDKPAIIVAGSGMCTGGRIVDHLKRALPDPENHIVFVGYQAMGTSGRDILRYSHKPGGYAVIDGERISIRAKVTKISGYSAHADAHGLVQWTKSMKEKPARIKLVHGEPLAQMALKSELTRHGYSVV